jgi:hypothetical protein
VQKLDWVWEMLKLALQPGLAEGVELPRVIYYDEIEAFPKHKWLGFANAVILKDRWAAVRVWCQDEGWPCLQSAHGDARVSSSVLHFFLMR